MARSVPAGRVRSASATLRLHLQRQDASVRGAAQPSAHLGHQATDFGSTASRRSLRPARRGAGLGATGRRAGWDFHPAKIAARRVIAAGPEAGGDLCSTRLDLEYRKCSQALGVCPKHSKLSAPGVSASPRADLTLSAMNSPSCCRSERRFTAMPLPSGSHSARANAVHRGQFMQNFWG